MNSSNHGYRGVDGLAVAIENDLAPRRDAAIKELTNAVAVSLKGRQQVHFPVLKTTPATADQPELGVAARVTAR
jgi:hypothetical protein